MDVSSFSDENFDTKAWINDVLLKNNDADKKENYTMGLVMKLQLYVQQVNQALEETSQQVLVSLPKIVHDTKILQQEALVLKEKMALVKEEVLRIEEDTGKSINSIEKLDNLKYKLLVAKQGLKESDNWTALVNDLEEVFDSKNVENISAKLLGMQNSLKLLVNISDYEDRKLQLEGLKNRLEAIASPSIVQAFTSNNIDQSSMFARIFSSIERSQELTKYYHKCQKDIIMKKWRTQLEQLEQDVSFNELIHNFYDNLLSNWHTQLKFLNTIFIQQNKQQNTNESLLIELYKDTLMNLEPSIEECITASLKLKITEEEKLILLQEIKETMKQFSINLNKLRKTTTSGVNEIQKVIFMPFTKFVSKYGSLESKFLINKLSSEFDFSSQDELMDSIQVLNLSIPAIMDLVREAKKHCKEITENCGFCGLLQALRIFFLAYADHYRVCLRQISRIKIQGEDWTTFQLCLNLLQSTGDVLINLSQLETELTQSVLLELKDNQFKFFMLNSADLKEFDSLVKCVTDGTQLLLMDHVSSEFHKLCSDIHHTTFQVIFTPISKQLDLITIDNQKMWFTLNANANNSAADLPDYSFSPQEYITQIGLYLMTLPQHLEPFLFKENPSLKCALKAADPEYANIGGNGEKGKDNEEEEGVLADVFLGIVARGACQGYCDRILSICELSPTACRQLAHDIGYFGNVLEDLGLTLTENLQQLITLLKLPTDSYQAQSTGCSARYVAAIRQIRNITSSS